MAASFLWSDVFETGLVEVDEQHHRLVDLINALGTAVSAPGPDDTGIDPILAELQRYTEYHFAEEEQLMRRHAVDPRHIEAHVAAHRGFIDDIELRKASRDGSPRAAQQLLDFLSHWLAYHILGSDQNLARQIRAIEAGITPQQAFAAEEHRAERSMEPLLHALQGLFEQVSERNRDLAALNQSLEAKVAQRTRALLDANRRLETLAVTDVLTQLPNRRAAMQHLDAAWATRGGGALSCMMIDADYFKEINDTYGHDAGDEVLRALAACLREHTVQGHEVYRLGGDEFLVICPGTRLADALAGAQALLDAVRRLRVATGDGAWVGSTSIGVAECTPAMADQGDLLKAADCGVYEAKRAGRGRVATLQRLASAATRGD